MLGFIPFNETVIIHQKGEVDSWGIASQSKRVEYPCYIRESVTSEKYEGADSRIEVPSYKVGLEGFVNLKVGDYVEIYGQKLQIKVVGYMKDFDQNIIMTKITV